MLTFMVSLASNFIGGFVFLWINSHYEKKHSLLKGTSNRYDSTSPAAPAAKD